MSLIKLFMKATIGERADVGYSGIIVVTWGELNREIC